MFNKTLNNGRLKTEITRTLLKNVFFFINFIAEMTP